MLQTLRGWEPDDSWHDTATATLTDWKSWNNGHLGTFAGGNGDGSQKAGNQEDVRDRTGAKNTSVEKEENRTELRAVRIELALSRNLEKEKSTERREASGQDQGECRDGESPQSTKTPNLFSQFSSKNSIRFQQTKKRQPNPRGATGWSCGKT